MVNHTLSTLLQSLISKNLKSWDEVLAIVEFAYNQSVHQVTKLTPFKIIYGFNLITPLDLSPIPTEEWVYLDGKKKAELVKTMHKQVMEQIERQNKANEKAASKGQKHVIFCLGDLV